MYIDNNTYFSDAQLAYVTLPENTSVTFNNTTCFTAFDFLIEQNITHFTPFSNFTLLHALKLKSFSLLLLFSLSINLPATSTLQELKQTHCTAGATFVGQTSMDRHTV